MIPIKPIICKWWYFDWNNLCCSNLQIQSRGPMGRLTRILISHFSISHWWTLFRWFLFFSDLDCWLWNCSPQVGSCFFEGLESLVASAHLNAHPFFCQWSLTHFLAWHATNIWYLKIVNLWTQIKDRASLSSGFDVAVCLAVTLNTSFKSKCR